MLNAGTISPADIELAFVTDDVQKAVDHIKQNTLNLTARNENADIY